MNRITGLWKLVSWIRFSILRQCDSLLYHRCFNSDHSSALFLYPQQIGHMTDSAGRAYYSWITGSCVQTHTGGRDSVNIYSKHRRVQFQRFTYLLVDHGLLVVSNLYQRTEKRDKWLQLYTPSSFYRMNQKMMGNGCTLFFCILFLYSSVQNHSDH